MTEIMQHNKNLLDLLQEDIDAEEYDNDKYMELANQADKEYPDRGYGAILRDIAKEESVHHKHLNDILHDIKKHM